MNEENSELIPRGIKDYFKFGNYDDLEKIVVSGLFLPVFVSGLSRSGKTCMIEQICHSLSREMIRVNFTEQTDEDDLIGGFRLENNNTVWFDGPVVVAMTRGGILLLDEIDLASFKCMCLQPILEGSPLYLKKTGRVIYPKPGFNIFATANTKGQGSAETRGKFVGARILNESFLDRFAITVEHYYPPAEVEKKIVFSVMKDGIDPKIDSMFVEDLVRWASETRINYQDQVGSSDLISTGRLIHIVRAYSIYKNPFKAVRYGISRFNENVKEVFETGFKNIFQMEEEDFEGEDPKKTVKSFMKKAMSNMNLSQITAKK